eukprot:164888_1
MAETATPEASSSAPTSPVEPYSEADIMDFAAALTITLPKNSNLQKITVYIDDTGEPAEGYVGAPLLGHCKKWTTVKNTDDIIEKLQGLMVAKIIICAATQSMEKKWTKFQNSAEYLYGFDQTKINIYKCPTRGAVYVDMKMWKNSKLKEN